MTINTAKFSIGNIVKHKHFNFRGVIYDVDFEFNNSEEWYLSIPKNVRPKKDQPFYHLLAENNDISYEAYVSEQNLMLDDSNEPIKHPLINEIFTGKKLIDKSAHVNKWHAKTNYIHKRIEIQKRIANTLYKHKKYYLD